MQRVPGEHPVTAAIITAVQGTALWRTQPLPDDGYTADWKPVDTARQAALKQYPDARDLIRAQLAAMVKQLREQVTKAPSYGPAERLVALGFLNARELEYAQ